MSTDMSPLVPLINQGMVALRRCCKCQLQKQKVSHCLNRHRTERLPESSGERFKRQSSKIHRGATGTSWSLYVLLQWMVQRGSASCGVVPTQLCGSWKGISKTWPYCRNGHHLTVQHLRFSVEESADSALLDSDGLLWSVKPKNKHTKGGFQAFHAVHAEVSYIQACTVTHRLALPG